ncbi:tyrosine-protein phosphatase [Flavobacterium lacus]|uniref:protein-tyrosine-phosphatase n=1 Tax=Flavobacterium lacus TaxID=1353778 RepID=A0A328X4G7_9FLAO|nr:CpsB/CapC family capsule biosynthesis tyrosine phosphatase [Flavobacterium lacus]RAR51124.1 tyrosine-protein phosphatase YwqE [Flavobacterium lacus]
MIFFSKKKSFLKDLIPDNFIDIHSHLIPGIDDGAKTDEEALKLITELEKIGFKQFITTPHIIHGVWNNTHEIIKEGEKALNDFLIEKAPQNKIKAAAEYMMDSYFMERLQNEKLLTLKDAYILVEMSYLNPPIQLMEIVFEIQVAGYKPILAHPERYLFYHENFDAYYKLKKAGCLLQLNLLSVTGYYGESVAKTAQKLVTNNMIDFVGSDVHHLNHVQSFENRLVIKEEDALKEAIRNNQLFGLERK